MAGIQKDRPETDEVSMESYLRIADEDDLIVLRSVLGGPRQDVALLLGHHFDLEHAVLATSWWAAPEGCLTYWAMHLRILAHSDAHSTVGFGYFRLAEPADQPSICSALLYPALLYPALACSAHF